jgi:hypothetical protein
VAAGFELPAALAGGTWGILDRAPVMLHILQVLQVCWDGKLVHLCSLLNGSAPALLGALADRLLIATRANAAGEQQGPAFKAYTGHVLGKLVDLCLNRTNIGTIAAANPVPPAPALAVVGRAEVSGRAISVLQPLLLGWASLAMRHLAPSGTARVRQELRTLVSSYDASQLGVAALERLAAAGFADVAAAVAARWGCAAAHIWHCLGWLPLHGPVRLGLAGNGHPIAWVMTQHPCRPAGVGVGCAALVCAGLTPQPSLLPTRLCSRRRRATGSRCCCWCCRIGSSRHSTPGV